MLEKTHNITTLLSICASYHVEWETLASEGAILNEYLISGRYPGDISFDYIGRVEAFEALKAAQQIRVYIRRLMDGF